MIAFKKILSASQTRQADQYSINTEPISSIDLMERASLAFIHSAIKLINTSTHIHIFCGCGNNGGDGFAIARLLLDKGYSVTPYLVRFTDKLSADCEINLSRIENVIVINNAATQLNIDPNDVIIDAIFGSGLNQTVINPVAVNIIQLINNSNAYTISVDCPSGLFCDKPTPSVNIVSADKTITFQRPKLSFFLPGFGDYANYWETVDIGLNEDFIQNLTSNYYYLDDKVEAIIKKRAKFSHKGNYGHALIIAGSYGKMGAAVLSAKSCLAYGVGFLTCHIPKCGYEIMQISVPQAMCTVDKNEAHITNIDNLRPYNAIAIGPGIGIKNETTQLITKILQLYDKPIVLDADALNCIAENKLIHLLPKNTIITPHPKEFERLFGKTKNSFKQLELAVLKAIELQIVIVLKGAHTAIINTDGKVFFNTTGSPALAQAGSGDKLTGIILSYLAQGYNSLESAIISVYLHGKNI